MKTSYLIGAIAMLGATAAFAEPEVIDQSQAQAEKKICRTERMTGSLTRSTRRCMTKAQWDALAEATRRAVNDLDRDGNQKTGILDSQRTFQGAGG